MFSNELIHDGHRRSVSLVTVEFAPDAGRTRLTHTEQYAFVGFTGDGSADVVEREGGTRLPLNRLRAVLADRVGK